MATATSLTAAAGANGALNLMSAFGKERVRVWFGTVQFSSSYPTGGEACNPGSVLFRSIKAVITAPQGGYTFEYMPSTKKLKAWASAGVEVTASTDLKALTAVPVMFIGL